jgi:Mrp family chromosome partitioning ATPase
VDESQNVGSRDEPGERRLRERLGRIRHVVLVLSGKGGVGKSTVAVNLAVLLAEAGNRVGLLDADIHGPSVATLLGIEASSVVSDGDSLMPVACGPNLSVMSIALLLGGQDEAVIWRGPMKMGALRQFLTDVAWGELDFLVIDLPPGTGDEPLSICQLVPEAAGGLVVTTPQDVSVSDVRRCVTFCRSLGLPVLGVLENMSGFVCPHCGEVTDVFGSGGGRRLAEDMGVPFLGTLPIDPKVVEASDRGRPFAAELPDSPVALSFRQAVDTILKMAARD